MSRKKDHLLFHGILSIQRFSFSIKFSHLLTAIQDFPGGPAVKNTPANAGDMGSIPGLGGCPGEGHGHPLQYPCLGNPVDRGAWWTTVRGVSKSQT